MDEAGNATQYLHALIGVCEAMANRLGGPLKTDEVNEFGTTTSALRRLAGLCRAIAAYIDVPDDGARNVSPSIVNIIAAAEWTAKALPEDAGPCSPDVVCAFAADLCAAVETLSRHLEVGESISALADEIQAQAYQTLQVA